MNSDSVPTGMCGSVLSDRDIRAAIAHSEIGIKLRSDDGRSFEDAVIEEIENPVSSLEAAGYLLRAGEYWDGKDFVEIDRSGYILKPNQHAVIRTLQYIQLSDNYCALHFGLHRNQMVGIFIGSGQVQPGWGKKVPSPLYMTIWNSGKTNFEIKRYDPLSRLIFLKMTSLNVTGRITKEGDVKDQIKNDLKAQTKKEQREKLERTLLLLSIAILIIFAFFVGPLLFPFLGQEPRINSTYGGILSAAFVYVFIQTYNIWKGNRK